MKKFGLFFAVSLLTAAMSALGFAEEELSELPETELSQEAAVGVKIDTELENGTMTIRLDDPRTDGLWWESWRGDKGDSSCAECITESTQDGYAYAGSFRAIDDGTDTIRLVRTDGFYVSEYLDFTVVCEDGKIKESTGGGQAFAVDPAELIGVIGGLWTQQDGGAKVMELTAGTGGGIDVVISDGSGRDGMTGFYTMTVYYDAIKEALIYNNGTAHFDRITDQTEMADEADEGDGEPSGEGGYGALRLESESGEAEDLIIYWDDLSSENETIAFVR